MAEPAVLATTLEILASTATLEPVAGSAALVQVPVAVATLITEDGPASATLSVSAGFAFSVAEQGMSGPPGPTGGAIEIAQPNAAGTWIIPHTLGRRPAVQVYGADGGSLLAEFGATFTTVTVIHANPTAGSVVLT